MTKLKSLAAVLAVAFLIGCASQRATYNTLASVEATTTAAFDTYLNGVIKGYWKTNDVPLVSKDYNVFKLVWAGAVSVAQWNTNAVATQPVTDASAKVLADITTAKDK